MNPISTYRPFGQPASATVTVNSVPAAGATVTVAGVAYTYGTNFFGLHPNQVAEALAATLNADRGNLHLTSNRTAVKSVYAFTIGPVVALMATVPGTAGNSLALATSDSISFTISGATFSGGTSTSIPVTTATITASPVTSADVAIAVAGTRVQLAAAVPSEGVIISADQTNTGVINVGDVTVTSIAGAKRGLMLTPAGMTPLLKVSNANTLYINGDHAGDKVGVLVI